MESRRIKIEDLPDLLTLKSGLDLTELSKVIGISRVTLNNWRRGMVNRLNHKARNNLATALDKNKWGFRINGYHGNQVEIHYIDPPIAPNEEITYLHNKIDSLQNLLNKVLSENFVMKDKIEKYEGKK